MPLGTEVGIGRGHIVLDGVPAPPTPKGLSPQFSPMSIVAKRSLISATAEHLFLTLRFLGAEGCPVYSAQQVLRCYGGSCRGNMESRDHQRMERRPFRRLTAHFHIRPRPPRRSFQSPSHSTRAHISCSK